MEIGGVLLILKFLMFSLFREIKSLKKKSE